MSPVAPGHAVTALAAALLLAAAWWRARLGRALFAALFLGAAVFNAVTALRAPEAYVEGFAPRAVGPFRPFIERVVALAPDAFVLAVALGQLLVAAGLASGRRPLVHAAAAAGAAFLVALSFLGVGAAFPANLAFAGGLVLSARGRP